MEKQVYSLAFAIANDKNEVLFGKRSDKYCKDYLNFWSLPSCSVTKQQFEEAVDHNTITEEILNRISKKTGIQIIHVNLLIHGERIRETYHLHQAVFGVINYSSISTFSFSPKYSDMRFMSPDDMLIKQNKLVGTCISLYFSYLIQNEKLPTTFRYFEVDPRYVDTSASLVEQTPQELWKQASGNYKLMVDGKTGTEGKNIRLFSVDRYIDNRLKALLSTGRSFLDVGCGDGALVNSLINEGIDAWGAEIGNSVLPEIKNKVFSCDVVDIEQYCKGMRFDVVLANLLFEWTADLSSVLSVLRNVLTDDGVLVATMTPPEYQRGGKWIASSQQYSWLQQKCAHRPKELVMINRCVGPLWFFPRSIADIAHCSHDAGLAISNITDIYVDSFLTDAEKVEYKKDYPYLFRQKILPIFTAFEFKKDNTVR